MDAPFDRQVEEIAPVADEALADPDPWQRRVHDLEGIMRTRSSDSAVAWEGPKTRTTGRPGWITAPSIWSRPGKPWASSARASACNSWRKRTGSSFTSKTAGRGST
jgi:hypothetical protein